MVGGGKAVLWLALFVCACEKRKSTLVLPQPDTVQALKAKTFPEPGLENPGMDAIELPKPSPSEAQELLRVKQEALDRLRHPSPVPGKDKVVGDKGKDLFNRGRQLVAAGELQQGIEFYLAACQLGHFESCHKYGWHEERLGNAGNATRFYKIACDGGISKSCNNYGFYLEKNLKWDDALDFYARSCLDQHQVACVNLKRLRASRILAR